MHKIADEFVRYSHAQEPRLPAQPFRISRISCVCVYLWGTLTIMKYCYHKLEIVHFIGPMKQH